MCPFCIIPIPPACGVFLACPSLSLRLAVQGVDFHIHRLVNPAAGPMNLRIFNPGGLPNSEMRSPHALSGVAVTAIDLLNLSHATCAEDNPRADCIAIRFRPFQLELDPIAASLGSPSIEQRRLIGIGL